MRPPDLDAWEDLQLAMADIYRGVRKLWNTGLVPRERLEQFVRGLDQMVLGLGLDPADFSEQSLRVGRRS